jgi:ABC-type sugar transport system permease subunit
VIALKSEVHHQGGTWSSVALSKGVSKRRLGNGKSAVQRGRGKWKEGLTGYLFILPSIIGFSIFVVYPLISSAYYSLTRWDGNTDPVFIGFRNYIYMFTKDPSFMPTLKATALFTLLSVPSSLILGLLLAVLLNRNMPGIRLFRTALYLPAVLPSIATLTLWKFIYNPQFGLANQVLSFLHLPTSDWLSSANMALPSLVIIGLWGVGSTMIIFLAGLQAVPQELYEAARLDGAGQIHLFARITLPMISPIIFLQLVLQIITALQAFNQPQVLTNGGPNFSTNLLMLSIYANGFGNLGQYPQLGYAMAQVWVLFFFIIAVTAFTFRVSSIWVYEESSID